VGYRRQELAADHHPHPRRVSRILPARSVMDQV